MTKVVDISEIIEEVNTKISYNIIIGKEIFVGIILGFNCRYMSFFEIKTFFVLSIVAHETFQICRSIFL